MNVNLQVNTKTKSTFDPWIYFVVSLDSELVLLVEQNLTVHEVGLFEDKCASKHCFCYTYNYVKTERVAYIKLPEVDSSAYFSC
jgi:hypothetical protein